MPVVAVLLPDDRLGDMLNWCSTTPATTRRAIAPLTTMSQVGRWLAVRIWADIPPRAGRTWDALGVLPGEVAAGEPNWLWARICRASWRYLRAASSDGGGKVGSDIACLPRAAPPS